MSSMEGPTSPEPRGRVLIVDDEPQNLGVLARILTPRYEVLAAPSGARALELAVSRQPDLVLLDVVMPDLDGYAVLERLKANPATAAVPVLFVTGLDSMEDEERGLSLGAVDYIPKPYRPPVILARVATHLALKRSHDQLARRRDELEAEVARRTQALVGANQAAEAGNRAKTEFLAAMSHELRTPLNGVLGMAQLLRLSELTADQQRDIDDLERSAESLLSVINDILEFTEAESSPRDLEQRPCALREFLGGVLASHATQAATRGTTLRLAVADALPAVVTLDEARVGRVLGVLLRNAVAFTPGGQVRLEAHPEPGGDGRARLRLCVHDTGQGMGPEVLRRLFVPFSQGDGSLRRRHGGLGLGLALAERLLQHLGGTIAVASTPAVGSTFTVTVPVALA